MQFLNLDALSLTCKPLLLKIDRTASDCPVWENLLIGKMAFLTRNEQQLFLPAINKMHSLLCE